LTTTRRARAASSGGNRKGHRSAFGSVRRLPSGRYQARYTGPDQLAHTAPTTFETKADAHAWLSLRHSEIVRDVWEPPQPGGPVALAAYAETWLTGRDLKPRTRAHYRSLLDSRVLPALGSVPVRAITPDKVRAWHAGLGDATPTMRAHAYGLLRSVLGTAVHDGLLAANPCHIRGAGTARRVHKIKPLTVPELAALVGAMPDRYRLLVLLAAWCGLRFGELAELRRRDVDLTNGVLHVRRGVVRVNGQVIVGTPKSTAGMRDVAVPPHLLPMLREHLHARITGGRDGLLFPAADGLTHLAPSSLYRVFYPARERAGRPDLRWHDLRHTGAVLAAQSGATLADLMHRLGHSTPAAAMRYQHAAAGRDAEIAKALSALVEVGNE
jgi:integrase